LSSQNSSLNGENDESLERERERVAAFVYTDKSLYSMEAPLSKLRSINKKVGPSSHWYLDTGISCTQYFVFFRWGFDRSTSRIDPAEGSCLYPPAVVVWIPFRPMVSASTLAHLLSSFSILDLPSTFQQQFGSLCSIWSCSHINTQSRLLQSCCHHPNLLH